MHGIQKRVSFFDEYGFSARDAAAFGEVGVCCCAANVDSNRGVETQHYIPNQHLSKYWSEQEGRNTFVDDVV